MKNFATFALIAAGFAACTLVWADDQDQAHEHAGWFDHDSCEICKPMGGNQDLMMAMNWETHKIKNGMLMVASVPDDHLKTFRAAWSKMDKSIADITSGKVQPKSLCGFCQSMGGLMHAGAEMEKIKTNTGLITLVTAQKPETVKMIHKHAERTQEEAKKMLTAAK